MTTQHRDNTQDRRERYEERQRAMGRKTRSFRVTPEEALKVRGYLKQLRGEKSS